MKGYVYIIQSSKNQHFYIGSTLNVANRIKEHNSGETKSIRNKGPWIIKFTQEFPSLTEARRVEFKLKRMKRRDYIEKIIEEGYIRSVNIGVWRSW